MKLVLSLRSCKTIFNNEDKEQEIRMQIESISKLLHQYRVEHTQQFKLIIDKLPQIDVIK